MAGLKLLNSALRMTRDRQEQSVMEIGRNSMKTTAIFASFILMTTAAGAMTSDQVRVMDQDLSGGTVTAESVMADANG